MLCVHHPALVFGVGSEGAEICWLLVGVASSLPFVSSRKQKCEGTAAEETAVPSEQDGSSRADVALEGISGITKIGVKWVGRAAWRWQRSGE